VEFVTKSFLLGLRAGHGVQTNASVKQSKCERKNMVSFVGDAKTLVVVVRGAEIKPQLRVGTPNPTPSKTKRGIFAHIE
jgi:hypothetical protein